MNMVEVKYPTCGKIWKEYWIDCACCGDHTALAETAYNKAIKEADLRGWKKIQGRWFCASCLSSSP